MASGGTGIGAPLAGFGKPGGRAAPGPFRPTVPKPPPTGGAGVPSVNGPPAVGAPVLQPGSNTGPGSLLQQPGARGAYHDTPGQPAPGTPSPGGNGQQQTPPPGDDSLDSTYFGNVATNTFNVGNKINALTAQGAQNEVALQSALAQLSYQQPRAQLASMQAENARGGLYSSVEGQQQGDLVHSFNERQNSLESNAQGSRDSIARQVKAEEEGVPIYNWTQSLASALRQAKLAQANPAAVAPPAPKAGPVFHDDLAAGKSGTPTGAPSPQGIVHGTLAGATAPTHAPVNGMGVNENTGVYGALAKAIAGSKGKGKSGGVGVAPKGKGKPSKSGGTGY